MAKRSVMANLTATAMTMATSSRKYSATAMSTETASLMAMNLLTYSEKDS